MYFINLLAARAHCLFITLIKAGLNFDYYLRWPTKVFIFLVNYFITTKIITIMAAIIEAIIAEATIIEATIIEATITEVTVITMFMA